MQEGNMFLKAKPHSPRPARAQKKAVRMAAALPPDSQSLAAVYALGIRDGLRIAADIRAKILKTGEDAL